ncbi:MAG TPA: hypothetical protein VEF04_07260 [Blastocatellia bacterium]|nr:hypothetical protein [Blastocatellia bacterium]
MIKTLSGRAIMNMKAVTYSEVKRSAEPVCISTAKPAATGSRFVWCDVLKSLAKSFMTHFASNKDGLED